MPAVLDVSVIDDPVAAAVALEPTRSRILGILRAPGSATTVAQELGITRQRANYHLRALEQQGLLTVAEERPRRGFVERILVATANAYVVSPDALGDAAVDPSRTDRLSSRYLIALAARVVREVALLARRADERGQALATLAIDTEIRFASAADRAAFTEQLAGSVTALAARYHDEHAANGRWFRLTVTAHPRPAPEAVASPEARQATSLPAAPIATKPEGR